MTELQAWLDMAPTLRTCDMGWNHAGGWEVLLDEGGRAGIGNDASLTFAVVAAILDFRKNQEG